MDSPSKKLYAIMFRIRQDRRQEIFMLNEDKIKLMSSIALFEKKEGKKIFPINRYFKSDYISSHMIRSFITYTFCSVIGIMIWLVYNIEEFFNSLNTDELLQIGYKAGTLYLIGLIVYELITFYIYNMRYERAKRGTKQYTNKLRRLLKRYENQNKSRSLAKEGKRNDRSTRV